MRRRANLQTTVPNNLPIPAVRAIANAPQNVTRAVARRTFAPPALAPTAPRRARKPKDAADTMGTSAAAGETTTMSKGIAAPTENVAADVRAACTGRAVVISEIPSSSRAWAVKASFAISCWATWRASAWSTPTLDVDLGKLIKLELGILAQLLAFAREIGLLGVGLRADGHILAGSHRHSAGHQSRDPRNQDIVLRRGCRGDADDQARGRDNAIVGPQHRGSQPPDAADEVVLRVQTKTTHVFLLSARLRAELPRSGAGMHCCRRWPFRSAEFGVPPVRSKPTHEKQYDKDDQDDGDDTNAAMTVAVTVAAEAATEATKQEDNE